ncbi:hypothetical protein MCP1_10124 [Candidatus Terasakiella magnetica]|nr:hypothetical protein MCP1_10124 [Candidatus Terasakiella magnetica]
MATQDGNTDPSEPADVPLLDELESNVRKILDQPGIHNAMTVVMARESMQILDRLRSQDTQQTP